MKKEGQSKAIVIVDKEAVDAVEKDDSAEKNSSDEEEENKEEKKAKTDENEEKDTAAVEGSKEETESTTPAVTTTVVDEATRFKYPHIASEILTCEVQQITEKISGDGALLEQLYSFMERGEAPLNPLLSSFFSKAFGILITRKSEQNWYSYQYSCVQVNVYDYFLIDCIKLLRVLRSVITIKIPLLIFPGIRVPQTEEFRG